MNSVQKLLAPFRVLDLTTERGAYFCAKILAGLGAGVTRVEKPDTEHDFWWIAYNYEKTLFQFDIAQDKNRFLELVKTADFLVESFAPGYLDRIGLGYATLKRVNQGLIMASISPYGQTGPYRDMKASDLELTAMSGAMHSVGDPDRPPVRISFPQAYLLTSADAAVGTMIALYWRERTGEGQQVDVSAQEGAHIVLSAGISRWKFSGHEMSRTGSYTGLPQYVRPKDAPVKYVHPKEPLLWQCKDGHVAFWMHFGLRGVHNSGALLKYMEAEGDLPQILRGRKWETIDPALTPPEDMQQIWDAFARFFARHTTKEMYQISRKERIELFPGCTVKDLLTEEQLVARGFWEERELPGVGKKILFPGPFARVQTSTTNPGVPPKQDGKEWPIRLPFQGVKVVDFSWVYTGPWTTQWLGVFGAEVIKVESSAHLDVGRRGNGIGFVAWNTSKRSFTLNVKHPKGQEIIRNLIARADVVVENFTPGTMQKLGLGYDELLKINPRIVMLSASTFGADGPHAEQPGLGMELTSLVGFNDLAGWPDRPPVSAHGPYTDILASRIASATLFSALDYQKRTGRGCYIDLSQFETSVHFLAPAVLEQQVTGVMPFRMGNRSLTDSPHGVFPCRGEDRWCALSVSTESEWHAFCMVLGWPEWCNNPRFATFKNRRQNEDELEKHISEWTSQLTAEEVMARLQQVGVKAGVVAGWPDLSRDPQLASRKTFIPVPHPQFQEYLFTDSAFRLETARPVLEPAPLFGEHNEYVCREILGMSAEEYQQCVRDKVLE